jgi:PelA/Pel-15E family pectate lyase
MTLADLVCGWRPLLFVGLIGWCVAIAGRVQAAEAASAPSLDAFRDGASHWKNGHDTDGYPIYPPEQVGDIADNLLRYQRSNGGWPSNFDPQRILSAQEQQQLADEREKQDTTFDNRATYPEVEYLAAAYQRLGDDRYRDAAVRGIEFILKAQYPNGGWPHTFPDRGGYHPHVTIVDDVMVGVLTTVRRVATGSERFAFVDEALGERVRDALRRGDACLLKLQVRVNGQPTGWASQYDHQTLEPTTGRKFELPGLISSESVNVVRYLMRIEPPTVEVRGAIEAAVAWLERSTIRDLRIERVPAEPIRYQHHTSRYDVVAVEDPTAPPVWARFYEIETNRPFMANRDGQKVYRLADVQRERRTGYSWYNHAAQSLLESEYPAWRKRWTAE